MKILVRGTNWVGDSVMSIPALRALRATFPDASITLHTRSWAEGVFRDADFLDDIISYERPATSIQEVLSQSRLLRRHNFDLSILFTNSFASALTVKLAGIPRRVGYAKEGRGVLLTDAVAQPEWKSNRHETFYYLGLIQEVEHRLLGTSTAAKLEPHICLEISEERKFAARELLRSASVDLSRPLVAIGPGSTNSAAKRWPAARFAELADMLHSRLNAEVVILGGDDDRDAALDITSRSQTAPHDLVGKTSLGDAAAVLSVCDLMISNDMGLAHLAPATGTPTITIFGPTNPETTRPFSNIAEVVRAGVDCSPCMLRVCPIDHRCMTNISVDQVFQTALKKLQSK
jgi:heptosyltransferase-2